MKLIKFTLISLVVALLGACHSNEIMTYSDPTALYFTDFNTEADSLTVSFTATTEQRYETVIKVSLLGNPITQSGVLPVRVVAEETTAKEGVHFAALEPITIEVGDTSAEVPLELIYSDELDSETVTITLELFENDDFLVGYADRAKVRIHVTNQVVKPSYWDSLLKSYFGDYSTKKHEDAIRQMGHDFPLTASEITPYGEHNYNYFMLQGRALCLYYSLNDVYDESGKKIETWPTF